MTVLRLQPKAPSLAIRPHLTVAIQQTSRHFELRGPSHALKALHEAAQGWQSTLRRWATPIVMGEKSASEPVFQIGRGVQTLPKFALKYIAKSPHYRSIHALVLAICARHNMKYTTLLRDFKAKGAFIPVERLRTYASFFNLTNDKMFAMHNSRLPDLTAADWTWNGRIFAVDNDLDFKRLLFLNQEDPKRLSLGRRIFIDRKTSGGTQGQIDYYGGFLFITEETSLLSAGKEIEENKRIMTPQRFLDVMSRLKIDFDSGVFLHRRTFYGVPGIVGRLIPKSTRDAFDKAAPDESIEEVLNRLFGEHPVFVEEADLPKILFYARNPMAPGRIAFMLRRSHPELPSIARWSEMIGNICTDTISDMEMEESITDTKTAMTWLDLLHYSQTPPSVMRAFSNHVLFTDAPISIAFQQVVNNRSIEEMAESAGINRKTARALLAGQQSPTFSTLIKIANQAENFTPFQQVIIELHSPFCVLLPDISPTHPLITIDHQDWRRLQHFNLATYLSTYRKRHKLTSAELGERLGVSYKQIRMYEQGLSKTEDSSILKKIAELLAKSLMRDKKGKPDLKRAGQIIYLSLFPEIAKIFPIMIMDPSGNTVLKAPEIIRFIRHKEKR